MKLILPQKYTNLLGGVENTEKAIKAVKDMFQNNLSAQLSLLRVTAPMMVLSGTGINDDLNGVERPVRFPVKELGDRSAEVVHSLAKWKRMKLAEMGIAPGRGIYTDMNALRPDEELDNIHSIYVDQWDWERVIRPEGAQELLDRYPSLDAKAREDAICREKGAVFVSGIGGVLSDGKAHDGRAADYDDWTLNGDLLVWNPVLGHAFELSSMGIRVDKAALLRQLEIKGELDKTQLLYHRALLEGRLPLTIGGGIGQSRLCMFLLRKAHIGEIQSSIWPDEMRAACLSAGIQLV